MNKKQLKLYIIIAFWVLVIGASIYYGIKNADTDKLTPPTTTATSVNPTTSTTDSLTTGPTTGTMMSDVASVIDSKEYAVTLNGGKPYFTDAELTLTPYESYAELDQFGRCGVAVACLSSELQPADGERRESISSVKPSGWQSIEAPDVDGSWLYNRCHLIGWQLAGENANPQEPHYGYKTVKYRGYAPSRERC